MIYLDNTTDNQTIFIDREMQSIENIKSITLDSNYYTKTEIDTEFLKVNTEIETITNRIDDLENDDDFLVISPVELGLNENNVFKSPYTIGEWRNLLNSNKTIILRMPIQANSMDNIEDSEVNYCERYIIGSDIFTGVQIIFKWYTLYFLGDSDDNYIPYIKLYKTEKFRYDALIDDLDERVTTLDENVTSLDERVRTLENNGANYYTKDEVNVIKTNIEDSIEKVKLKATPYTIRDDVNEILNLIRNGDATSNPFSVLSNGRNVLIRLKEDPNDWDIVCNVTSWFCDFSRKGWFIFSYYSDVDKELKTIKYTYDENNIANELKREIL